MRLNVFTLIWSLMLGYKPPSPFGGSTSKNLPLEVRWTHGSGDEQIEGWTHGSGTVADAATATLDLKALSGPNNEALDLTEVKFLRISAPSSNTGDLTFKPGTTNGFPVFGGTTPTITLKPGGTKILILNGKSGSFPTSGTEKTIEFSNASGAAQDYSFEVAGLTS